MASASASRPSRVRTNPVTIGPYPRVVMVGGQLGSQNVIAFVSSRRASS